jgi:hypothetical protein
MLDWLSQSHPNASAPHPGILRRRLCNPDSNRISRSKAMVSLCTAGSCGPHPNLGIAARYHFLPTEKPVLAIRFVLPLIGSVQTTWELNAMQVVSFAVLAFQNGFFWQAVLEDAKPATQDSSGKLHPEVDHEPR